MKRYWVILYSGKLFILCQQNADEQVVFFSLTSPELRLPDCPVTASVGPGLGRILMERTAGHRIEATFFSDVFP